MQALVPGIINHECPLCKHKKAQIRQSFTSEDIAAHLRISEEHPRYSKLTTHVKQLLGTEPYYFAECLACTYNYAIPNIPGDAHFYNLVYHEDATYPEWNWDFETSYQTIKAIIEKEGNSEAQLLEIGAGEGNFVKQVASNLIPPDNILTIEYSEYGKNRISSLGIKCLTSNILDIQAEEYKEKFDFVCLFQVLEHMNRLDEVFLRISQLMNKNASLLITVPNNIHRLHYEQYGIIEDVPPIHIGRWNKKCFEVLAKKFDLELIDYAREPNNLLNNSIKFSILRSLKTKLHRIYTTSNNALLNKILKIIVVVFYSVSHLRAIKTLNNKDLGISQWVHLRKES